MQNEKLNQDSPQIDESHKIGFGYTLFLIVGSIVGSMAWLIYSPMIARSSALDCIISFPIAAIMVLPLSFCVSELSSMFPKAGGPYIYLKEMYDLIPGARGKLLGFLAGWTYWMTFVIGTSLMLNGLSDLIQRNFAITSNIMSDWFGILVITSVLTVTAIVNCFPIKNLALLNLVLTITKLGVLFAFVVLCLGNVPDFGESAQSILSSRFPANSGSIFGILVFALGCFAGVEGSGCIASETKNASKTIPKVIFSAVLILAAFYTLTSIAISTCSSFTSFADNTRAIIPSTTFEATVPDVAHFLFGNTVGTFFNAAVIFSICACALPADLYGARVLYSVSCQTLGESFWMSKLHKVSLVPVNAVIMQFFTITFVAVSLCLLQQFKIIPNAFSFLGEAFGFIYGILCIQYAIAFIVMRLKRPGLERPFRVWGQNNFASFSLAGFVILTFSYIAFFTIGAEKQLVATGLILAGIPIFFLSQKVLIGNR